MIVNTRTDKIELNGTERKLLAKARQLVGKLAKHADGDLMAAAEKVADEMDILSTELAEQGKEEVAV